VSVSAFQRISLIGLGTMGAGIAQTFALRGKCDVRCYDLQPQARSSLHRRIRDNLDRMAAAGLARNDEIEPALKRITVCDDEADAAQDAQFIIEAVAEELAVKQGLFARLEKVVDAGAILASNTSTLKMAEMAVRMRRPERAVVAHWFNPPHLVPVVEVVPGPRTAPQIVDATVGLLSRIGKVPVRLSREIPGFIVNRVQVAMIREVWALLDSGLATPQDIDAAIRGSMGFRLAASGPLEIADFGGLDIWEKVFANLAPEIESGTDLAPVIRRALDAGHFGPKTGRGVYDYPPPRLEKVRAEREQRLKAQAKLFFM
jgi:3-hydroxybutyryl-CoA dehydrogenase